MEIIDLSKAVLIGTGRDRDCYHHPLVNSQCIKVSRRPQKQTRRERAYFSYLMAKNKDTSRLAHYLTTVQTNLGEGAAYELVMNDDGNVSSTLTCALRDRHFTYETIRPLLDELREYLLAQQICIRDLSPNNIMCQVQNSHLRLVIVDGVSNPGVNPLNIRISMLSGYFINKSWQSLERKVSMILKEVNEQVSVTTKTSTVKIT